ncbi:MAG: ROK family protein, partial [Kiritimatiellae bacterium]|nr:ROK family protein [Kiritimatiellia bacterium]
MMDLVWAVDFGGTGVKLGLVDSEGRIRARGGFPTKEASEPGAWMDRVSRELRALHPAPEVPGNFRIVGAGVGAPGFMDFDRGFVHTLVNVPGWEGTPLRDEMARRLDVPVVIDNDANAMALGEVRHGAGRGRRNVVFATLGTGVGGGLYLNGQIYRGAYSMAGEIGHVSIDWEGRTTRQGRG